MDSPDLVYRAGRLAGRAARTGYAIGRRLPGADSAERSLRTLEQKALAELRRRLDGVADSYQDAEPESLRTGMAELLHRSTTMDADRARDYLYATILRQLTPDEARILSVLSDGSPFPLVDVVERASLGTAGRVVLRNASTVGKAAGVSLLDHVPAYVTRLVGLGLAEIDAEEPELSTQYEILLTDDVVRAAEQLVKRARFVRRTVRVSPFGLRFWQACEPS
ncbi:Abi-alpha family protein [Saccharomonospora sp. NPDC046836]|uniref:Abi-alpha family protein n=1 Tax=Saccharomonospora sp. NPDC046836 TaxID=3156921 RepID=UPI0033F6A911